MRDEKPLARVRDTDLLRRLHLEWKSCVLCESIGFDDGFHWIGLSLHHISNHPRDDLQANLIMLCGHGTAGCHGRITENDQETRLLLGVYITTQRTDTMAYLEERFGATTWLQQHLGVESG